jgi:hypothetical protein
MEEKKKYLIEYYTKGINVDEEREVIGAILDNFNPRQKNIIEIAEKDYEKLVKVGLFRNVDYIHQYLQDIANRFEEINKRMIKNERYPLFPNSNDLKASMEWRDKLATFMPESECNKIVGCKSYKEHYPLVYKQMTQGSEETKEKNLER